MLLRLSGIPARATSGFRYAFPFTKADEYEVSSSCAHVWPEAYIENVGWIPFEPTGAYYALSDHSWHRADAKANAENNAQYAGSSAQSSGGGKVYVSGNRISCDGQLSLSSSNANVQIIGLQNNDYLEQ